MILFRLEQHYITHCYLKNTHLMSVAVKNCRRIREVATALHGAEMEHAPKYRRLANRLYRAVEIISFAFMVTEQGAKTY